MKIQIPVTICLLGMSSFAAAEELPIQKPGLWQITMTSAKTPGGSRSFKMCQDSASIAAGKASADAHLKTDCSKSTMRKEGEKWIAENECTFSGMRVVSHSETTVQGDDSFHTQSKSSYGGGKDEVTTIDQKYLGPCESGQTVGVPIGA